MNASDNDLLGTGILREPSTLQIEGSFGTLRRPSRANSAASNKPNSSEDLARARAASPGPEEARPESSEDLANYEGPSIPRFLPIFTDFF